MCYGGIGSHAKVVSLGIRILSCAAQAIPYLFGPQHRAIGLGQDLSNQSGGGHGPAAVGAIEETGRN